MLPRFCALGLLVCVAALPARSQQRPMTWTDVMQFRGIEGVAIAENGSTVAFTAMPDRGDPEGIVRATRGEAQFSVPRGSHAALTPRGDYAAFRLEPPLADAEARKARKQPALKPGLVLLATATGDTLQVADVEEFAFSADGRWLAYLHHTPPDSTAKKDSLHSATTALVLRRLTTGDTLVVPFVSAFAFDDVGRRVAYSVAAPDSLRDGLYLRDLEADASARTEAPLDRRPQGAYASMTWRDGADDLAFLASATDSTGTSGPASLWIWDGRRAASVADTTGLPNRWVIPPDHNRLRWTDDGRRLFFGLRARADTTVADTTLTHDLYDLDAILARRTVDVWSGGDSLIVPNQKKTYEARQQRTHQAVFHRRSGRVVALGTGEVDVVGTPENARVALGTSDAPYRRNATWAGSYEDLYTIDLEDGSRTRIAEHLGASARSLSPDGRFVAYYDAGDWHLYDVQARTTRTITEGLGVPFANEDHDTPDAAPGYGLGGWTDGDADVLVYDKYDVWQIPTGRGAPIRLTNGRAETRVYRVVDLDPDTDALDPRAPLLLSGYHDLLKTDGFYRATLGRTGVEPLLAADKRFHVVGTAAEADVVIVTEEDYDEFPDLWATTSDLEVPRRLTDVNPQMRDIAWGTSELVTWSSLDGTPLQGVVIKPSDYDPGRRYPVLVYFYELFSQRLHEFALPQVNHRPVFPLYASDGYVIFLPDVRFEIGRPGLSAVKSVVPGVQRLVDLGIADPHAVGLHGHSWSGYQAAFMVTQVNLFAAAAAGAPVSNMTSAYSGLRLGTGLARQFQYENGQSRMSGSLWDARDEYIDNSPVFFADRVQTPLLIFHGDADGAVPWEQSVELYLALRRLDKPVWLLEYRGEDHHPQAYPNKLDWAMRMKAFFDHYLKGAPAPAWLESGVPYVGD